MDTLFNSAMEGVYQEFVSKFKLSKVDFGIMCMDLLRESEVFRRQAVYNLTLSGKNYLIERLSSLSGERARQMAESTAKELAGCQKIYDAAFHYAPRPA